MHSTPLSERKKLLSWYRENHRQLPWRLNRDPYRIWLSETMLQQTTTTAVIPYFERFLERFPTLEKLASASLSEVVDLWRGLGYYSRAKNLHLAAIELHRRGCFPQTYAELIQLPGFGPYTARAVSSIAFGEPVGVIDGNVIRVFSRYWAWQAQWWKPFIRQNFQNAADAFVEKLPSNEMNQALMELGATICTSKNPTCWLCPLASSCQSRAEQKWAQFPTPKPKRAREYWLWQVDLRFQKSKIALTREHNLPFLRQHWAPYGKATKVAKKPREFDFSHSITHHDIYVQVQLNQSKPTKEQPPHKWVEIREVSKDNPTSLLKKILAHLPGEHE